MNFSNIPSSMTFLPQKHKRHSLELTIFLYSMQFFKWESSKVYFWVFISNIRQANTTTEFIQCNLERNLSPSSKYMKVRIWGFFFELPYMLRRIELKVIGVNTGMLQRNPVSFFFAFHINVWWKICATQLWI